MIVILEGANRCGKTTLAKHLIDNYGFAYFKDVRSKPKYITESKKTMSVIVSYEIEAIANLLKSISNDINLIVDRFHFTEFVYGNIMRGYDSNCIQLAENILKDANVKLVYLYRLNEEEENEGLCAAYEKALDITKLPYIEFDIKEDSVEKLNKFLDLEYKGEIERTEGKCII